MSFFLTIDVEDWFHVENLKGVIREEDWDTYNFRLLDNINRILNILDTFDVKATFFVLGKVAKKLPKLISEIHERGHEIASHGYGHKLIHHQSPTAFKEDISRAKEILEDIIGERVLGYRAPSFSITDWAVNVLKETGYEYDSSFVPATVSVNKRYGRLERIGVIEGEKGRRVEEKNEENMGRKSRLETGPFRFSNGLWEFPIGVLKVAGRTVPWGGGAYFRLIPFPLFRFGVKSIMKKGYYMFYFHPWEIDPGQPRIKNIKLNYKIRQYWGLNRAEKNLKRLLRDFDFGPIRKFLED